MKKYKYFVLFSTVANLVLLVGVFSLANFKSWDLAGTVFLLLGLQFCFALIFGSFRGSFESRIQNRTTLFKSIVYLGSSLGMSLVFFLFGFGFLMDQTIFKVTSIILATSLFVMVGAISIPLASELSTKPKILGLVIIIQLLINLGLTLATCLCLTYWFD